jgi:hypothetical protein
VRSTTYEDSEISKPLMETTKLVSSTTKPENITDRLKIELNDYLKVILDKYRGIKVVMKRTRHSDYKLMRLYIDVADAAKASTMKLFNR